MAETGDMMHNYAMLELCAIIDQFMNAWEEGDGDRILQCLKLHFYVNGRTKYS